MRVHRWRRRSASVAALAMVCAASTSVAALSAAGASAEASRRGTALDHALNSLVHDPHGPPGIAVVLQRGDRIERHRAGTANLANGSRIRFGESMRLASVSKAFSGAAALALVAEGKLSLTDTVGKWLPRLHRTWSHVTLRELLQHTSGIPDYTKSKAFARAFLASPLKPPPPRVLLTFAKRRLDFRPGTKYEYSNSDNVVAALMIRAAAGRSYEAELRSLVLVPFGLAHTSLPRGTRMPAPFIHGYQVAPPEPPEDVTGMFAAGWAWASGGVVSTPRDANAFVRAYVRGATIDRQTRRAQFRFTPGRSDPPGPGKNSAGLALFRYRTRCGTVYGHTGSVLGYTQFVAANRDGTISTAVSVNSQVNPATAPDTFKKLRRIYTLAVCEAVHR